MRVGVRPVCHRFGHLGVALHQAPGFELQGVYRRIGWKFGSWWDVGWWQLQLGGDGPPADLQ